VDRKRAAIAVCLVVGCVAVAGCWVGGELRYREHPELTNVTLATGERKIVGAVHASDGGAVAMRVGEAANDWSPQTEIGPVHATRNGYGNCDGLVADVLADLLAESRALGGVAVREVKFRNRWAWSGKEPLCSWGWFPPFELHTEAQGMAVK
jgi:hypothetical protein